MCDDYELRILGHLEKIFCKSVYVAFIESSLDLVQETERRGTVGDSMGVKAAGGIRDYATALAMVKAGANRLGCSAGVLIAQEEARLGA